MKKAEKNPKITLNVVAMLSYTSVSNMKITSVFMVEQLAINRFFTSYSLEFST